ncbi:enoyl-CoA hydratase/isomerase family protein [Kineosporia rhizophila]|uniref:enoyl-CoA hydratase/isomerase family protein n=1 Tax=Kineosporia rhizophila TaxID=84633 RepID=UPI001E532C93|nr:enoyl-CoA hydratase/isomerase family protein [Kineosporia rhizophila]
MSLDTQTFCEPAGLVAGRLRLRDTPIGWAGRDFRACFARSFVEPVYEELTQGYVRSLRLDELLFEASQVFPGLVPDASSHAADPAGAELDQAIFLREVLRSPRAGRHLLRSLQAPSPRALMLQQEFENNGRVELASVTLERRDGVGYLTFSAGDRLNAEDEQQVVDFETAVDLVLLDDQIRVGVLRGGVMTHPRYQGRRVFSAGINLKALNAGRITLAGFLLRRELGPLRKLMAGLQLGGVTREKPWIAAVDGFAIGGGMQILLTVDHVIAESGAYASLPAAKEGIVPGVAALRLPKVGGPRLARQVILAGRRIEATEPAAAVIFDEVVEPSAMDEAIARAVSRLAAPAVVANRRMLGLAIEPEDEFRLFMAEFAYEQAQRIHAPDVLAKVGRFAGKGSKEGPGDGDG